MREGYMSLAHSEDWNPNYEPFQIGFKIYIQSMRDCTLVSHNAHNTSLGAASGRGWNIKLMSGLISVYADDVLLAQPSEALSLNTEADIFVRMSCNRIQIYYNGVVKCDVVLSPSYFFNVNSPLMFGRSGLVATPIFNGALYNIRTVKGRTSYPSETFTTGMHLIARLNDGVSVKKVVLI